MLTVLNESGGLTMRDVRKLPAEYGHKDLLNKLVGAFERRGWDVRGFIASVSGERTGDQSEIAMAFNLELPELTPFSGHLFCLGIMSAPSRYKPILYVGTTMPQKDGLISLSFVFDTIIFDAPIGQTVDLDEQLRPALDQWSKKASRIHTQIDHLMEAELKSSTADRLLMRIGRLNKPGLGYNPIMPWARIGMVDHHWQKAKAKTKWSMLKAFSRVVQKNGPREQMNQLYAFYMMLEGA